MSTKETIYREIDCLTEEQLQELLALIRGLYEDTIDDMNKETRAALDDIENGRNLSRAFYSVEELMEDLNAED